jgi:mRNA-degrading endonuclease RelE of RelBE toxin-antitoxin system
LARVRTYVGHTRKSFEKDVKKRIPESLVAEVFAEQQRLSIDPYTNDGPVDGVKHAFKVRVQDYRIVFFVHKDLGVVDFFRVRHRKEVYNNLPKYNVPPELLRTHSYRRHDAGLAERELERLLRVVIAGTRFEHKVFAVGGYVRDELLGKEPADLDIAVEMPYGAQRVSAFLQHLFPDIEVAPLALDYPIWHVSFPDNLEHEGEVFAVAGSELDITDTQTLVYLDDESTTEYGPIAEDVKRRDFTVNTLFKDLSSGEIIDPTGTGQRDLERGVLRAVPAVDSLRAFREQPRQMLRLIRFMVQYDWQPDPPIQAALAASVDALTTISGHGLKKEFHKLKEKGLLDGAMALMAEYGMLASLREAWQKAKAEA